MSTNVELPERVKEVKEHIGKKQTDGSICYCTACESQEKEKLKKVIPIRLTKKRLFWAIKSMDFGGPTRAEKMIVSLVHMINPKWGEEILDWMATEEII